jgi:hypothetical protein
VLDILGPVQVNSHTARIAVEMDNPDDLAGAVRSMGGVWLGFSMHKLFSSSAAGHGFTLPGWKYPLVLDRAGELHYDDYKGKWGNVADLARLRAEYVWTKAKAAADLQGWLHEQTADTLTVYHPQGGTLTIKASGEYEAAGFIGAACHEARETLGIEALDIVNTPEAARAVAENHLPNS